jgi:hypothetical protein
MPERFLSITEAVKYTGKSRRTLHRYAHHLAKTAPAQVMREKTDKGDIWKIHQQSLQPLVSTPEPKASSEVGLPQVPLVAQPPTPFQAKYLEIAQQGYGSMMAMHHEVKVTYEALLHEKDLRIQALTQALDHHRRSFWQRLFRR